MDWLQERGLIADECVAAADVAPVDCERLLRREADSRAARGEAETAGRILAMELKALARRNEPAEAKIAHA